MSRSTPHTTSQQRVPSEIAPQARPTVHDIEAEAVDLRMLVARACGFDDSFRQRVFESRSNSLGAIYFTRTHVRKIAQEVGTGQDTAETKADLYASIRQAIGRPSESGRFDSDDLIVLAMVLGFDVTSLDRTFPRLRLQQIQGGLLSGKHLDALIQRSHADLYLAGDENGRIFWPWRVLAADEVSMPNRESCSYLVVDSVFSDPDWGNRDTLEKASDVKADAVILADVYHDPEATVEQVLHGLDIVDEHTWSGDVFLPVQPPVDTSIRSLLDAGVAPTAHKWALGGLKDASDDQRIAAARRAREELGEGPHLHGLGFGVTDELASALRDSPDLLDSVDSSTSVQNAIQETTAGEQRLSAVGALAGADLIAGLRKLSSCVETNQGTRTTLADFQ